MKFSTNVAAGFVRLVLASGLIVMLAGVSSVGLQFERRGGQILTVQTNSMKPVYQTGDAIIAWRIDPANLQIGDVVSYRSLRDPRVVVSHRIVAIDSKRSRFVTKGDALNASDPAISGQAMIGRVTAVAPGLGRLLTWLRSPLGVAIVVYVPGLIILSVQTRRLIRIFSRPAYQLYDR